MQFRVGGVDAKTGRDVEPLIVEADGEAAATSEARRHGVRPTSVKQYTPPQPGAPSDPKRHVRSTAPVLLGMLGVTFWGLAFCAMAWAVNEGNLLATITFGTFTICGLICIVGGMIIGAVERTQRP